MHVALFPTTADILGSAAIPVSDAKSDEEWKILRAVRDEVLKALEAARNNKLIGTGLEAQVAITASGSRVRGTPALRRAASLLVYRLGGDSLAGRRQRDERRPRGCEKG